MTIILTPETEAKLNEKARLEGRDPNSLANAVLADFLDQEARQREEDAAIQVGLDAISAGRWKPVEQVFADLRAKHGLAAYP